VNAAIDNAKILNGAISTAKIGEAQIDTLRLASGAVVTGQIMPFNITYGRTSGTDYVSIGVHLPFGGTPMIFWDATTGEWDSEYPRNTTNILVRTSHYGIIYNELPNAGVRLPNLHYWRHQGFYIGTSLPANSTFVVDFVGARPGDRTVNWAGRAAVLVFQR
jgi:hypothetical protein